MSGLYVHTTQDEVFPVVVERKSVGMEELWTGNWDVGRWSMLLGENDELFPPNVEPGRRSAGKLPEPQRTKKAPHKMTSIEGR